MTATQNAQKSFDMASSREESGKEKVFKSALVDAMASPTTVNIYHAVKHLSCIECHADAAGKA